LKSCSSFGLNGHTKKKTTVFDTKSVLAIYNHHFKRYASGNGKVTVETGLLALAHNLRKKIA
jgi:hypothetical protein